MSHGYKFRTYPLKIFYLIREENLLGIIYSNSMSNVSYEKKNLYTFPTEK